MAAPLDQQVDAIVKRILDEARQPVSATVEALRTRVAELRPSAQRELLDRARIDNEPLFVSGQPTPPPPT